MRADASMDALKSIAHAFYLFVGTGGSFGNAAQSAAGGIDSGIRGVSRGTSELGSVRSSARPWSDAQLCGVLPDGVCRRAPHGGAGAP